MNKNIGLVYSSFNNYDLLENEVLKRVDFENYPVINIDDGSDPNQVEIGKKICRTHNIYFEKNKKKGVQFALAQGIEFLKKKYNVKWVFCLQQDIFPLGKSFFTRFDQMTSVINDENIGAIGFNVISKDGIFMDKKSVMKDYYNGKKPQGLLGTLPFSKRYEFSDLILKDKIKVIIQNIFRNKNSDEKKKQIYNSSRIFSAFSMKNFENISKLYKGLFAIDMIIWAAVAVNVKNWDKFIKPREGYRFHLWFPDIGFQFLQNNIWLTVNSDFYMQNDQKIKEKYGYIWSSAHAGRERNNTQVERYGDHLKIFKNYWKFDYEDVQKNKTDVIKNYKNTLIEKFLLHDYRKGPLKKF